jgi:hypothetical protein
MACEDYEDDDLAPVGRGAAPGRVRAAEWPAGRLDRAAVRLSAVITSPGVAASIRRLVPRGLRRPITTVFLAAAEAMAPGAAPPGGGASRRF